MKKNESFSVICEELFSDRRARSMYIVSKKSADKIIHDQNCPYAKRISTQNREYYHTMAEALASGKMCCGYCAVLMRKVRKEMNELRTICEENGIDVEFDHTDGSLDIKTSQSIWKLSVIGGSRKLRLYHKNTVSYDNGTSPYEGFHLQNTRFSTIHEYMEYIANHDRYKQEQRREKKQHAEWRSSQAHHPKRHIEKMRSSKGHYTARDYARMSNGTYDWK